METLTIEQDEKQLIHFTVQNVVASVTMEQTFNLIDIHKIVPNSEYNPKKFPGLVYRIKRPKSSILIFSTAKMVCTGTKSKKQAISAVHKVVKDLKWYGIVITSKPEITIQNIVASGDLGKPVDLELAADILDNVMYEPEQFPGLILRMKDPKVVCLVFATGKGVCTGAKSEEIVTIAVNKLYDELDDFGLFLD